MRLPKLCKMELCGGQDQLGIPDLLVFVSVTSIKIRTFTRARLCVGQEPDGYGPSSGARGSNSCTKVAMATIVVFSLEA